jgi:anti-sigma factor RsiW
MFCDEAQELITALVDGELSTDERLAIEDHLNICGQCREAVAAERRLKQQSQLAGRAITAPATLRRAVEGRIGARPPVLREGSSGTVARWFSMIGWRPAFALATLLLVTAALVYTQWPAPNIGLAALETHVSIFDGKIVPVRSDNPAAMRDELARAVGERFRPVTLDLSMMKLYPVSGFVQKIGRREVLVTVYQGEGPAVTCFTFLGSEADAPDGAEKFYDADMRLNFYSFSRDGVNGLLHREGGVICVVVSKMPAADLLAMIRGKSAHA